MAEKSDQPTGEAEYDDNVVSKTTPPGDMDMAIDPAEERRLVRKLDRYIMPVMAIVYFFQCM